MTLDDWFNIAGALQSCVPFLSLTAYIPQWRTLLRSRSSQNVSLTAWIIWTITSAIALLYAAASYAVTGRGLPLVFSTTLLFLFCEFTLLLVYRFRKPLP